MLLSLSRHLEKRGARGLAYRELKLVKGRKVVKVVWGDRPFSEAIDRYHLVAARNARIDQALHQAHEALSHAEGIGKLVLAQSLFAAPVGEPHVVIPPGSVSRHLHCKSLYPVARHNVITAADYNELSLPLFFMQPGNRLRRLRKMKGITQAELAELTGVSQPAISQLENGTRSMDLQWMRTFARALQCAPADILEEEDNPYLLDEHELALIERYRAADRAQRETLDRVAAAVVPMPANDAEERAA